MLRDALPAVSLALALATPLAHADVYVLVEDDGTPRFSNAPDDPRYKLYLREPSESRLKDAAANARSAGDPRLRALLVHGLGPESGAYNNPLLVTKPYQQHVTEAARQHRLDPALVHAVIAAESNYNPNAVSGKGAVGLMQLMPDTGRRYGVKEKELKLPALNIAAGTRYLADLIRMFDGDLSLALAGYNAGENMVVRYGRQIPPYAETQAYVPRVLRFYEQLRVH